MFKKRNKNGSSIPGDGKKSGNSSAASSAAAVLLPALSEKHAFSGRAYARHSIAVLVLLILVQSGIIFFLIFNMYLTAAELNKKNFAVFREKCDGSIESSNITGYQTSPDEMTVRSLAWNVVRLIKSAGSGNSDVVYDEASRLMTGDMRRAFTVISDTEKANLKRLAASGQGVYRVIDSQSVKIKMLDKEDLPPGTKTEITQYDAVVSGKVRILTKDTNQEIGMPEEFAIRIHAVPLNARSESNPWGLLVSSMDILDPNKSLRRLKEMQAEKEKQATTGTSFGDALGLSPEKMKQEQEQIKKEAEEK